MTDPVSDQVYESCVAHAIEQCDKNALGMLGRSRAIITCGGFAVLLSEINKSKSGHVRYRDVFGKLIPAAGKDPDLYCAVIASGCCRERYGLINDVKYVEMTEFGRDMCRAIRAKFGEF